MQAPFIAKLEHGASLTDDDRSRLAQIIRDPRPVRRGEDLISEGDAPEDVQLIVDGLACRYKVLRSGRRQVMALLLPGDFCDFQVAILGAMDHSIATISACRVVAIPPSVIEDLSRNYPNVTRALWWASLVDEAVLREWLVTMGGRPADQRLAHLFCELHLRMQVVGRGTASSFDLPVTQEDLADTMGLSVVHVNRSLKRLREMRLIIFARGKLTIINLEELRRFCGFNPNYLHLRKMPEDHRHRTSFTASA